MMFDKKKGVCVDCNCERLIYSKKRCQECYWKNNAKENEAKKKKNGKTAEKKKTAKEMNLFFASQIPDIPNFCEECGESLKWQKQNMFKSIIGHILPKRKVGGFPSVATNPNNRMFFCLSCHQNFDNKGEDFAPTMNCFDLMCERFMMFENQLSESDKQRLPYYFKDLLKIKY